MGIKVLLVDDHVIIRESLRQLIETQSEFEVIGEAEDGQSAVQLTAELLPDVVIMDIGMPNLNGIEATRQITRNCPTVKVLSLSMYFHRQYITEMMKAGSSGYLSKDCAFDELVRAIRVVVAGQRYLSPQIAGFVIDDYVHNIDHHEDGDSPRKLTRKEYIVLQNLAEGKTSKETALAMQLSVKTVEAYRRQIMNKLNLHSVAELTKYALLNGISFLEPQPAIGAS